MKSIPAWVLFSLICLSFSLICKADLIYSNLGPGDEVAAGSLVLGAVSASDLGAASEQNAAQLFQSGRNFNITSFTDPDAEQPGNGHSLGQQLAGGGWNGPDSGAWNLCSPRVRACWPGCNARET